MRLEPQGPQEDAGTLPAALEEAPRLMEITRVYCAEHGRMQLDWERLEWACRGWAGEGCLSGMLVTLEDVLSGNLPAGTWMERSAA